MTEPRRVLLVSYQFPPVGGAGVQRAVKFVKYLPEFGWRATVLTVANPSVPVLDRSLEADLPPGTEIRRARTLEPGYAVKAAVSASGGGRSGWKSRVKGTARRLANLALQPDPQILWAPGAIREGLRAVRDVPHQAVLATGPPFSSFLSASRIARKAGLPLALDYRDEWGISNAYLENKKIGRASLAIQGRMQGRVLRAASALIATTRPSAAELERLRGIAGASAEVACIYNGFDPDDFEGAGGPGPGEALGSDPARYRLAYVGTLWNLTDVSPLVEALRRLSEARPEACAAIDLVFAGRRTGDQEAQLDRLRGLPCRVERLPYVDHTKAVDLIRSSDSLLVLLSGVAEAGRVVPAKVFESMAARRPILTIAPEGEARDLLDGHPAAGRFDPADVAGIAGHLAREVDRKARGDRPDFDGYDPSRYSRRELTRALAGLLDRVALPPGGPRP